ncbi:hypothetical protein XELAEV_18029221mg [Xenopus laevis]|uniref:Uncharacterized protein n=1 Tax=Xenopus laevis TaxID=8355 RepID=A0A974CTK1_XENLA|nr:hypothetical protein XELAEV_18029221mg [Xenopus laevis]
MHGTFSYTDNDMARISGIFGGSREFLATPSATVCRRKFESLSKKQVELQLHGLTLTEYLHVQRIPRGLRVNLQPTLFAQNEEFKQKFAGIINKCSRDLMALNIEFIERELKSIDLQIAGLQDTISGVMSTDELSEFKLKMDTLLEKYKCDVITRKKQKFDRDTLDYEKGHVYNWTQSNRGRDGNRYDFQQPREGQARSSERSRERAFNFLSTGNERPDVVEKGENKNVRTQKERKVQPRREVRNK